MYLEDQLNTDFTRGNHMTMLKNVDCCLFVLGGGGYLEDLKT
jgi:hypothetical protein